MGMSFSLMGLTSSQMAALRKNSALVQDVVLAASVDQPGRGHSDVEEARARLSSIGPLEPRLDIDKSWHILHYLFTGHNDDSAAPGNALLSGQDIGPDIGFGPAQMLNELETAEFAAFLQKQVVTQLKARVNCWQMSEMGIYALPGLAANIPDCEEQIRNYDVGINFPRLRDYVVACAAKHEGLLKWIE